MSIKKLRAGRVPGVTAAEYVGIEGTIFWNESTGELRLSDGATPGGSPLPIAIASPTVFGGIKLGPGITTNAEGQIIIDSTGLDFSFGDFQATTEPDAPYGATLSSIDPNQDINIVSNGTGSINVIGEFNVYKPDDGVTGALAVDPIIKIKTDGQIKMLVPGADSTEGAVGIVGGLDGVFQPPLNTGVMLHVTGIAGTPGVPSRIYNDAQNAFAAYVARRYNGTAASPTAVLADEEIMRLSGTAHNGTNIPGTANNRIVYKALGNQTLTNAGGAIELWTTPLNSTTLTKVATIDNANGITATKFTGPLTGNVTGNADTVTNGVYTTGSYSDPSWLTISKTKVGLSNVENTALSTSTHYIGTTSIQYNRASASQSLTGVSIDGSAGSVAAANLTGTTLASNVVTSSLTSVGTLGSLSVTNTITAGLFNGKTKRNVRDAGTIADAGTVTIDFLTDDVVLFVWGNGVTLAYANYTAGRIVKVIARKAAGTGVDTLSLGGVTAANTSSGGTTFSGSQDTSYFIELTCTNTTIGSIYVKV